MGSLDHLGSGALTSINREILVKRYFLHALGLLTVSFFCLLAAALVSDTGAVHAEKHDEAKGKAKVRKSAMPPPPFRFVRIQNTSGSDIVVNHIKYTDEDGNERQFPVSDVTLDDGAAVIIGLDEADDDGAAKLKLKTTLSSTPNEYEFELPTMNDSQGSARQLYFFAPMTEESEQSVTTIKVLADGKHKISSVVTYDWDPIKFHSEQQP